MDKNVAALNIVDERKGQYTPPPPKGHHVILASMIKRKTLIELDLVAGGSVVGLVTQFDEQTITIVEEESGEHRTYYKHAIESFGKAQESH